MFSSSSASAAAAAAIFALFFTGRMLLICTASGLDVSTLITAADDVVLVTLVEGANGLLTVRSTGAMVKDKEGVTEIPSGNLMEQDGVGTVAGGCCGSCC